MCRQELLRRITSSGLSMKASRESLGRSPRCAYWFEGGEAWNHAAWCFVTIKHWCWLAGAGQTIAKEAPGFRASALQPRPPLIQTISKHLVSQIYHQLRLHPNDSIEAVHGCRHLTTTSLTFRRWDSFSDPLGEFRLCHQNIYRLLVFNLCFDTDRNRLRSAAN